MTSASARLPAMDQPNDDRQQLENIQQQLVKAWVTRDRSILERLLALDWKVTHTDGRMSSRARRFCAISKRAQTDFWKVTSTTSTFDRLTVLLSSPAARMRGESIGGGVTM